MSTKYWEPGTQYNYGDVVEYEGHKYKVIQPHFSQGDWAPGPATAALWGRLSDDDPGYGGDSKPSQPQQQSYQQQPPPQGQYDQQPQDQPSNTEGKHWYGDEETKEKLEIGGGLAAGAALLAGGLFAYNKHKEDHQEAKAGQWSHDNWLQEAQNRPRSNGPVTWVLTQKQDIPNGAILVGKEKSWNLYICRSFYDGGLQLGKASEAFKHGGVLGYKNKEVFVNDYEVLVGDMNQLRWVSYSGQLNVENLGYTPVETGCRSANGKPLYIAEAPYNDAVHPGKTSEDFKEGAFIPYDGTEKHVREYRVLCYNNPPSNRNTGYSNNPGYNNNNPGYNPGYNNNNNPGYNPGYNNNNAPYNNNSSSYNNPPDNNPPYNNPSRNTSYNDNSY
jgi:hypothetical protein